MNKILIYTFTLLTITAFGQQNPCVPNETFQDSLYNLWPDTIANLPIATVGEYYETSVQLKTPATVGEALDTNYYGYPNPIIPGTFIDLTNESIDSIMLVNLVGLPEGMSIYLSEPDSIYNGNDVGCVTLYGTPTQEMIGHHDIVFELDGWISYVILINLYEQTSEYSKVEGYNFVVNPAEEEPISVIDFTSNTFQLTQNIPNPFNNSTEISYFSPQASNIQFQVNNIMGKVVKNQRYVSQAGENKITFEAANLSSGIYFYTISNGKESITKKMIISAR